MSSVEIKEIKRKIVPIIESWIPDIEKVPLARHLRAPKKGRCVASNNGSPLTSLRGFHHPHIEPMPKSRSTAEGCRGSPVVQPFFQGLEVLQAAINSRNLCFRDITDYIVYFNFHNFFPWLVAVMSLL